MSHDVFTTYESEVRVYCRHFPATFVTGRGHLLYDEDGREYVDFLSCAGALNYGHNDPVLKAEIIEYLRADGVLNTLDLHTAAKRQMIEDFVHLVLEPRHLQYKLQFTGPTGTNAVEAALKLARKVTGRSNVVAFTNGYHGASLGSLAATASPKPRAGAGIALSGVTVMPFDGFLGARVSTLPYIEKMLTAGSGVEPPAAFLLEAVQGEGGLNVASREWLAGVQRIARAHGALLIVDDIQAGCGRTGTFFSFEGAGIEPDIVCLSKSLSGLGLPLALVLIKPDLDRWQPGEHTGTFRGNNLAFVGASAALRTYWRGDGLRECVATKARVVRQALDDIVARLPDGAAQVKGRGLLVGLELPQPGLATAVSRTAFERGLIVETCGVADQVIKLLPPLTIPENALRQGLHTFAQVVEQTVAVHEVAQSSQTASSQP